jgi:hypothetical protein
MSVLVSRLPVRSIHPVERNLLAYRHNWIVLLSGFFEPVLYLFGIGFGIGTLVKDIPATPCSWRRRCWPPRP